MKSNHKSRTDIDSFVLKRPEGNLRSAICFFSLATSSLLEECIAVLHPRELTYFNTLKFDRRKRSYLIGRYAAKQALSSLLHEKDLTTILIDQGIFSQPIVIYDGMHNVQVSITHCEEQGAAIAFPEAHPMGIDIERMAPDKRGIFESQVTEREKEIISRLPYAYDMMLALLWTAKEALSKALKTGLMTPFETFELSTIEVEDSHITSYFQNFGQYKTLSFTLNQYACSIVCPKKTELGLALPNSKSAFILQPSSMELFNF